ncbi:hypothetical protein [Nonomuraea sp. NPDC049684]|uniref:hypothetical protein n=1 Tax=Nonomuraea sp. NPDC049684 TaxID=3364356 RepID=UPI0037A34987
MSTSGQGGRLAPDERETVVILRVLGTAGIAAGLASAAFMLLRWSSPPLPWLAFLLVVALVGVGLRVEAAILARSAR